MITTNIRAVVFDMDGVLIDSHPAHMAAWKAFLRSIGKNFADSELSFIREGRTRNEILHHFLGELTESELQEYGKQKDEIFHGIEQHIQAVPGVIDFLRTTNRKGVGAAVATSASEIRTVSTIQRMGLAEYFEAVITASDVVNGKPDPSVYRLACERLKVAPGEALAFDDAPAGVRSAKSAGLRCVGVSSDGLARPLLETGAEIVIPDFVGLSLDALQRVAQTAANCNKSAIDRIEP